jgi:hypothetical protein
MGVFWSKIVEKSGITSRSRISQGHMTRPLLSSASRPTQTISANNRQYINFRPEQPVSIGHPLSGEGGPEPSPSSSRQPSINSQSQNNRTVAQPQQLTEVQLKMLEQNIYEDFFKKTKNIKQIHQRHATTCANVLNKGLEATAKLPTGAPSIWDIKELAPNTSLTGIGIQQCMQVSDFLLSCKSKNVNYIINNDYSSIEEFNKSVRNSINRQQSPELRPMVIFCCSELLRTQQTLFISYFDIIKDYLKTGRKVIVLFWLNEQHVSKMFNADNFVVSLTHTKIQWKYFINRIKNLESDKNFMEDIGREKIAEFSEKLKLETTGTLNYEEWEDIFYVSPIIYFNNPTQNMLLNTFSFDNRRFTGKYKFFSKQTFKAKTLFNPEEMYKLLPRILAEYISRVGIIGKNKGVDFYEEELSQDVKMNLVMVSHHNSCENTLKYLTNGQSKENVFNKQQLMNAEIVILPKSGILFSREYSAVFTDNDFKVDNIRTLNIVRNELNRIEKIQNIDKDIKNSIKKYFSPKNLNKNMNEYIRLLQENLLKKEGNGPVAQVNSSAAQVNSPAAQANSPAAQANSPAAQGNSSAAQANSPVAQGNSSQNINTLKHLILYLKYLSNQPQQLQQQDFLLKNRIFPVGFYDMIFKSTIRRKNKTSRVRQIYPLFILYNSLLDIFFTPLDVVKQEVAIIPEPNKGPVHVAGAGIETSSEIFSLSSPFRKFLDMSLEDYSKFLETSKEILKKINDMYNPQSSRQPEGVSSAAVEGPKRNTYFYDYDKLSKNIQDIITNKISPYKEELAAQQHSPTLLQYLRKNFDTKTLVHHFGNCLFDFCAIIEPAKNRLRQIVREKLKLEVGEKNYADSFNQEVARRLKKFVVDYEKEHGEIKNTNTNTNAKIILTYNERYYSKKEILKDSDKLSYDNTINAEVIKIYSKYLIIDVFEESKILKLIEERNRNITTTNRKTIINAEISRILQPFQKKFMGMLIHKNIRNNGELNVSTQINREASYQSFGPSNPFCPMTVRGNRNVLDEIIAFYKAGRGMYKKAILKQVKRDYGANKPIFVTICENYLKMNDNQKITDFYNSYIKIIIDEYGILNVTYSQRANIMLYIPLFYRYDTKLEFFKNIYLVNSLNLEKFATSFFMMYLLRDYRLLSDGKTDREQATIDDSQTPNYRYVQSGNDIITNIFQKILSNGTPDVDWYKQNLNKIKLLLYYIIEYNNPDVKEYYNQYGLVFFYFTLILPNLILYEYTKKIDEYSKQYEGTAQDENNKNIDFIFNLLNNETDFKDKSKNVISIYLKKFKTYIESLYNKRDANKYELRSGIVRNNNNVIKFNKNNIVRLNEHREVNRHQNTDQVDIYTTLLMERVYFAT